MREPERMTDQPSPPWKEGRTFGFTMGVLLGVFGGVLWRSAYHAAVEADLEGASRYALAAWMAWGTALVLAALALAAPQVLVPVNKGWMAFAEGIGFVMSRVVLGITYFFVLTPIAVLRRRRGANILEPHFEPDRKSYWVPRQPKPFDRERYQRQY